MLRVGEGIDSSQSGASYWRQQVGPSGSPGSLGGGEVLQNGVCSSWQQELRKARALTVSLQMEWFLCDES